MAKTFHRKAAKDYPNEGISKGDMYWYAKIKTGQRSSRVIRSLTPIPMSKRGWMCRRSRRRDHDVTGQPVTGRYS